MEHSPLTWGERGQLWLRLGLRGVLALGGGSVIDCAKCIAAGVLYDGDPWDFSAKKAVPERALPLFTVLTMAATGSFFLRR